MKTLFIFIFFAITPVFLFAQCNPNAGSDDQVCGNVYSLQGSIGIVGSDILWTSQTPGVFIENQNSLTTEANIPAFTGLSQIVTFVLSETNTGSSCTASDTVQITFYSVPHPEAGPDQLVCDKYVVLCASTTPGADGYWQSTLNAWYDYTWWPYDTIPCPPCSSDSCVVAYYSSENDTVSYFRTEYNGYCYGYDSVNVYFASIQAANTLVDPADSINCGRNTDILVAQEPTYGDGFWYDSVPLTQFFPNNYNDNPDSTVISNSSYGMHYFYWVTVNGNCRDTSDVVPINFILQPEALAGLITSDPNTNTYFPGLYGPNSHIKADTVCGLAYQLHGVPSCGNGLWFTLDPTNTWFESSGTPSPSPIFNDIVNINYYTVFNAPYYRQFVWMEDNQSCVDKDTIRLYFAPVPSGNYTATMPACRFDSSMIVAYTWPLPNNIDYGLNYFDWNIGNGVLWDTTCTLNLIDTIFLSWGGDTTHTVSLMTYNVWGCHSPLNIDTIYEPPQFNPSYAVNPATCGNCNGEVILYTDNNSYSFEWLDSSCYNSYDTIQYGLCPGFTYPVIVSGYSLSPDASTGTICHDTIGIAMTYMGLPVADFDDTFINHTDVPYSLQLYNLSLNADAYQWKVFEASGNTLFTSMVEDPIFTFVNPGCYNIQLIAKFIGDPSWFGITRPPCYDTTTYYELCLWPTGVSENNINEQVIVFPNPMTTSTTLEIPNFEIRNSKSERSSSDFDIRISDLTGKVVCTIPQTPHRHSELDSESPHARITIERGNLKPGVYIIEINGYRTKLIVE